MASSRLPVLGLLLLVGSLGSRAVAGDDQVALLDGVSIEQSTQGVTIRVDLSHARQPRYTEVDEPCRAILDFHQTRLKAGQTLQYAVNHELVRAVRVGQVTDEPPVTRLVLDLSRRQGVRIARENDGRTLFIGLGAGGGQRPAKAPPQQPRLQVTGARWELQDEREASFTIALSELTDAKSFFLSEPDRLVIDLAGALLQTEPQQPAASNGLVSAVRMSQFEDDVVRCVLDLKGPAGYAVLKRLNPSRLEVRLGRGETRGRRVVIDPGHGAHDSGCVGYRPGLLEKNVVVEIGRRAAELLRGKGVEVRLTRDGDTFLPLSERPALANAWPADLFVSIHCNAMPNEKKGQRSGSEVYYYTAQSEAFAEVMLAAFGEEVGLATRGTYQRRFVVVREALMPAVLVEAGYLDHAGDGQKLSTPEFQQRCAMGIMRGVMRFLQRLPGGLQAVEAAAAPQTKGGSS